MAAEFSRSSGFVIPKKPKKEPKGYTTVIVPQELFQELMVNDNAFQHEIVPPFVDNLLLPSLKSGFRLSNAKRVHNLKLAERFLRRQTQLRRRGTSADISYGFLLLDGGDPSEEEYLCTEGIFSGYSIFDELGPTDQGICLSMHPDCCTPAFFFERVKLRILIFKILKGRSKVVQLKPGRESVKPDPAFHSHIPPPHPDIQNESALTRFRYSQIFLYEFNEKNQIVDVPSCVMPWAAVTVSFNTPGPLTRCLLLPNERDAHIWTGSLKFQEVIVESVDLLCPLKDGVKPGGFCAILELNNLVFWSDCLSYFPISQLITAPEINGMLVRKRLAIVTRKNGVRTSVSYFTLNQQSSPLFRRVHNTLRRGQLAGLSILPNGTTVFVIPNGELSSLLGLPSYDFPTFHCLFFFADDVSPAMEYSIEANNEMEMCLTPQPIERLDGGADAISNAMDKFNVENNVKFMQMSPPHASSQPSPSMMGLMSGPPPQIHSSMMMVPPPPIPQVITMGHPYLYPPPPPPRPIEINRSLMEASKPVSKEISKPVSQEHPQGARTLEDDNRAKNKNLIQQTLENVRNVGKNRSPTDQQSTAGGSNDNGRRTTISDPRMAAAKHVPSTYKGFESNAVNGSGGRRDSVSGSIPSLSDPRAKFTPISPSIPSTSTQKKREIDTSNSSMTQSRGDPRLRDPRLKRMVDNDPEMLQKILKSTASTSVSKNSGTTVEKFATFANMGTSNGKEKQIMPPLPTVMGAPHSPSMLTRVSSTDSKEGEGELPMDIDDSSDGGSPQKASPTSPAPSPVAVETPKPGPSHAYRRGDEAETSLLNETNLSEAFSGRDFVTSTPKITNSTKATTKLTERTPNASGFNFEFLNWETSRRKISDDNTKSKTPDDDMDDQLLCIAEEATDEGPKSPTTSPPPQPGLVPLRTPKDIPLEAEEKMELDTKAAKDTEDVDLRDLVVNKSASERPLNGHGERDAGSSIRLKLSDQPQVLSKPFGGIPPPGLVNPNVSTEARTGLTSRQNPIPCSSEIRLVSQVKPFSPVSTQPPHPIPTVGSSSSQVPRVPHPFPIFDRVPVSPPLKFQPTPSPPQVPSPGLPLVMHRLDVPPPSISRPPPISSAASMLLTANPLDPRVHKGMPNQGMHQSLRLPTVHYNQASTANVRPDRNITANDPRIVPSSSVSSSRSPLSINPTETLIIIPDPDLILSFAIQPIDFEQILECGLKWKHLYPNKRISIKWHSCTTKALITERSDPAKKEKCNRFLDLIEVYADHGLIEYLKEHLCDQMIQPRNPNKYMICCMNAKRAAIQGSRVVFLSVAISTGTPAAVNFTNNGIELRSPYDLLQELKK